MLQYGREPVSAYCNCNDRNVPKLSPSLMKSINKIIQNEDYTKYSFNVIDISTGGENYLSILKQVDIQGVTINNNKEINLFIKQCLPDSEKNVIAPKELYFKEVFMYTEVADLFNELQNEFNVPNKEKYIFTKYYKDGNDDCLIFDNMMKKGFKIYNRFDVAPLEIMELLVKQLAKFHAFSMVLKQYRSDFYKIKIQSLKNSFIVNDNAKKFVTNMCNISLEYLEDNRKIKVQKSLDRLLNDFYRGINENEGKINCLCHGDYRICNILLKQINGEAATVIPIDYQAINYGSPMKDFIYLVFLSTDQQLRREYMEYLKNVYFNYFKKFLRYFNIDVELVCTRKDLEDDFKSQLYYGLIISLIILPFVLVAEDDVPELNNEIKTMKLHRNFKQRIAEIVDDFVEWGYL